MENKKITSFFVITFLWSWFFFGIAIACIKLGITSSQMSFIGISMTLIGAFGPVVGAIVTLYTIEGKDSLNRFKKSFLSLNFGLKTWLAIFLILGIPRFIAWISPIFFGEEIRQTSFLMNNMYLFIPILLFQTILGGGQEEIGWRGYIMQILENKFGLLFGSLILGITWSIWHIPMWFLPESGQLNHHFFGFTMQSIGLSFIFSWIIKASGNRLLSGLIIHGASNTFSNLFPGVNTNLDKAWDHPGYWIWCILIILVGIIIVILREIKKEKPAHNKR